jgi:hypothetical protein
MARGAPAPAVALLLAFHAAPLEVAQRRRLARTAQQLVVPLRG